MLKLCQEIETSWLACRTVMVSPDCVMLAVPDCTWPPLGRLGVAEHAAAAHGDTACGAGATGAFPTAGPP
jgi:hypothetical protein